MLDCGPGFDRARRAGLRRALLCAAACILLLAVAGALWCAGNWPFTRQAIVSTLEARFAREVEIGGFRETWFPPGCVAEDVRFLHRQRKDLPPLIVAQKLVVKAGWAGLVREHIDRIEVTGVHLIVPPANETGVSPVMPIVDGKSNISGVAEIEVVNADVEILSQVKNVLPTRFVIHRLVLDGVQGGLRMPFRASISTVKPSGALEASGQLGPWKIQSAASTEVSGRYRYADADLSAFSGLAGKVSSGGNFSGTLGSVRITGSLDVPEFHVDGSAHNSHLTGAFQAIVDTRTADTVLENVKARVGRTVILGRGKVAGAATGDEGKTAALDLTVNSGRVEDLLNFFSGEKTPAMTGEVQLRAHVELPPGGGFLKRVRLTGDFGVAGSRFTSSRDQEPVDHLSESAYGENKQLQQEDPRTVLSHLAGHVVIENGTAKLVKLSFEFPGAAANMEGTYNLIAKTVNIRGTLRTQGKLSDATSGFKAVMLKVVTPFLQKRHETVAPFSITGPVSNPSIGLAIAR